jgi:predicted ATPase/DNA-binding winged helix-turn-helix (wHTH) protein/Flp pilus assembly protein TadD
MPEMRMSSGSDIRRSARVSFGPFRLNVVERTLEKDSQPVRLGGRALDILIVLLEHHGEIVLQRDLVDRVWPNIHVNDGALRVQVWGLRQALGDGVDGARYIANIPGRGYRFVGAIEGDQAEASDDNRGRSDPDPTQVQTNLARRLGPLIGREVEVATLSARVAESPLVTIVGGGGVGKSSLANEVGWRSATVFPEGVWLIDLAPVADGIVVPSAVAGVLGVSLESDATAAETIAGAIGKRRMLLIFDNCERLTATIADLIDKLLQRAPALSILAASQEPLRLDGEQTYRLDPLALPPAGTLDISAYAAVTLFVERAREADQRFKLTAENAPSVAEICRRLDGNPLALEMAAARLLLLGVEGLREGLDKRLRILKTDRRSEIGRYQTLRSMVEWSYGLLDAETGPFFRRLAIFPGSFTLNAAVAVGGEGNTDHWDMVDLLGRLVSKSLVVAEASEPPRFRLLETLRLFGLERLAAERESASISERHARYFSDLFDGAYDLRETMPEEDWFRTYIPEIDNVRAALDWALTAPERPDIAISLSASATPLWETLGMTSEAQRYIDKSAHLVDPQAVDATVARFWGQSGYVLRKHDTVRAAALLDHASAMYRQLGDRLNLARFEGARGLILTKMGRFAEAKSLLLEAQTVLTGSSFKRTELMPLVNLGYLAERLDEREEAQRYYTEALELADARRFFNVSTTCRNNLAALASYDGDFDRAIQMMQELIEQVRASRDRQSLDWYLGNLSLYLSLAGRVAEARAAAEEILPRLRFRGGQQLLNGLAIWAWILVKEGRHGHAARLNGFVVEGVRRMGFSSDPTIHRRFMDLLGAALPAAEIEACMAAGAGWSEDQAFDFVMNCGTPQPPPAGRSGHN